MWDAHRESHLAFIAVQDGAAVGMAWLALDPRPPRPGDSAGCSADVQSLFVLPERRGRGAGSALVRAATQHALDAGAVAVTAQAGSRSLPLYARLGFRSSPQLLQTHA